MPTYYARRTTHRYVDEYYTIEASDEDEAMDMLDDDLEPIGFKLGSRIKWTEDGEVELLDTERPRHLIKYSRE